MQEISRRNFMKIGAAGALALAASSASATQNAKDVKFDEEYDVVVIGSGFAGSMATLQALKRGKKVLMIGEPLCVYKSGVLRRCDALAKSCRLIPMPLSEAMLYHWMDVDRGGKYRVQIKELTRLHDEVLSVLGKGGLFTSMDTLFSAAKGKLDFCVGDMARYRFSKLLVANKFTADGILMLHSNEENAALVNKVLAGEYREQIHLPLAVANLDFEHGLNDEEVASFIHYL